MGFEYAYSICTLLFLALQFGYGNTARELIGNKYVDDHMDPSLNVFFKVDDLYAGKQIPIYFAIKNPSTSPHLLPREEADSIPFSSSKLDYLLKFFTFSKDSIQAKAMTDTLGRCELDSIKGETKYCATSLESMLDFVRSILGPDAPIKVLTTNITRSRSHATRLVQKYTVLEDPKLVSVAKMVACHTMPYPYAVYYCHGFQGQTAKTSHLNKLYTVSLVGENGDRVDTLAACHMDTSQWDTDHVGFKVLRIKPPGSAPVCHFFPVDNLVWIPIPSQNSLWLEDTN